jgi:hypothetical protein
MFDNISEASAYVFGALDLITEVDSSPVKELSIESIEGAIESAITNNNVAHFGTQQDAAASQFLVVVYDGDSFFQDPEI